MRPTEQPSSVARSPTRRHSTACSSECATSACRWSRSFAWSPMSPQRPAPKPTRSRHARRFETMITTRIQTTPRLFVATISVAALALAVIAAPAVGAAGLRNCVDVAGPQSGRVGCYEDVWADGTQYRMTFSNTRFTGATPKELDPFYVLAPQTDKPQGAPPNTFPHDHVVR